MNYRIMKVEDVERVLPFYIEYYNSQEGTNWTKETAYKRIHQVLTMEDSFALLMEEENRTIGFAMGFMQQYDDLVSYVLEEILIDSEYQNKGYGRAFLNEVESRVKENGAACVELKAVNDEMHDSFYGKANYHIAENFVPRVKWFD